MRRRGKSSSSDLLAASGGPVRVREVLRVVSDVWSVPGAPASPTEAFLSSGGKLDEFDSGKLWPRALMVECLVRAEDWLEMHRGVKSAARARGALRVVRRRLEWELYQ